MNSKTIVKLAQDTGTIIPAFNIPYLPMVKPVIQAIKDEDSIAMIQVARLEWEKFQSKSLEAVAEEYFKYADDDYSMLHLDHVPVIDEDNKRVEYLPIIKRALAAGYQSVMVDGSRLPLEENIAVTREAAELAHSALVACEAELGSVMGHESGPICSYDELFNTKKGFTDIDEARRFACESSCDWLSVAAGSIHGAIAENLRHQKKPEARLDIGHIKILSEVTGLPLVLHGGTGINSEYILKAIKCGIAKINVATEIRQAYERALEIRKDVEFAREAVYLSTRSVICDFLHTDGNKSRLSINSDDKQTVKRI